MARCVRGGVSYRRHKVVNGMCVGCGAVEVSQEQRKKLIDGAVKQMRSAEFDVLLKVLSEGFGPLVRTADGFDIAGEEVNG